MATILRRSSRLAPTLAPGIQPETYLLPNSGPVQAAVISTDTPLLVSTVPDQRTLHERRNSAESIRTESRTLSEADITRLAKSILQKGSDNNNGSPTTPPVNSNRSKGSSASDVCSTFFRLLGLLLVKFISRLFLGDGCVNLAASIFFLVSAFTVAYRGSYQVLSTGYKLYVQRGFYIISYIF